MVAMGKENRRYPRVHREENLSLTLLPASSASMDPEDRLFLTTRDISPAGVCVEVPTPIKPDTDVEVWIALLQDRGTYHLYGTVAWCAAPEGTLLAGIALDLERADGRLWASQFQTAETFD